MQINTRQCPLLSSYFRNILSWTVHDVRHVERFIGLLPIIVLTWHFFPLTLVFFLFSCNKICLGTYTTNLCAFYFYNLIGKLTVFHQIQEFFLDNLPVSSSTTVAWCSPHTSDRQWETSSSTSVQFHYRRSVFSSHLRSTVGNILKDTTLRINLNIDGNPVVSKSHTHPSHSDQF